MDTSISISIIALFVSIISLFWQIYREWKENRPNLLIKYRFAEKIECTQTQNRIPVIEIIVTNLSQKAIFINRPLLCFSTGLVYFKRSNNYEYINYPYKLEPRENFKTGVVLLQSEKDGQVHLQKGDAVMVNDILMEVIEDATVTGTNKIAKSKDLPRDFEYKDEIVSCYFEVKDTQGNYFKSPEFKFEEFIKDIKDIRTNITINPLTQNVL